MSLLKVLKISESWCTDCESNKGNYEQLEQEIKNCMLWLQDYFQVRQASGLNYSEKQAVQKIQRNYKCAVQILRDKQDLLRAELELLRRGRQSGQLYNDVATL